MLGLRRGLFVLLVAVFAGACGAAPAAEPAEPAAQTTSSVPLDIGEPAVLDRDDPNFSR